MGLLKIKPIANDDFLTSYKEILSELLDSVENSYREKSPNDASIIRLKNSVKANQAKLDKLLSEYEFIG